MQISGEYGTELLIRYTEEQTIRDLERRRIADERLAEHGSTPPRARLAAMFGRHSERMPSVHASSQIHAAHR